MVEGIERLPDECMSLVLSLTSPKDACRSALVSPTFRFATQSENLWEHFLPDDYRQIISRSVSPVTVTSKKDLFFRLSDSPIFLDDGNLSFAIDKRSGKKCFMLGARRLQITWAEGDTPQYWKWSSEFRSRFREVAHLQYVWWLEIYGRIEMRSLSTNTGYIAYLVYEFSKEVIDYVGAGQDDFFTFPVKTLIKFFGTGETLIKARDEGNADLIPLNRRQQRRVRRQQRRVRRQQRRAAANAGSSSTSTEEKEENVPMEREDGWIEIEIGEFYCGQSEHDYCLVEMGVREIELGTVKHGLIVHGIEIRPKPN